MTDQQRLINALRQDHYHTPLQSAMAGIILQINGIDAALAYVAGKPVVVSIEAAEALRDLQLEDDEEVTG